MARTTLARCCVLLMHLALACGGTTAHESQSPPEDAGTDAPPDAATKFCQGPSKLEHGGALVVGMPVTTSATPIMSCCANAVARLHTKSAIGFDIDVGVKAMGGFQTGTWEIGPDTTVTATLRQPGGELWAEPNAIGSATVTQAGGDQLTELSLCLVVLEPGDPLTSVRLWLDSVRIAPPNWDQRFGIWLLADPALSATDAAKLGLAALVTEEHATVPLSSIGYYQASTHRIGWAPSLGQHAALDAKLGSVPVAGRPFIVQADDQRVYLGAFVTNLSSFALDMPAIVVDDVTDDGFVIEDSYPPGHGKDPDPRNDPRILQVLTEAQKLVP